MNPNKSFLICIIVCLLSVGANLYICYYGNKNNAEIRSGLFTFADSIADAKLNYLKIEYAKLDSAQAKSEALTVQKKQKYESIKKPDDHRITTTDELDSFWSRNKSPNSSK